MPRGASPKREREYKTLVKKFKNSGRYGGRSKEVAARIVNKQRSKSGETKKSGSRSSSSSRSRSSSRTRSASPRARSRSTSRSRR